MTKIAQKISSGEIDVLNLDKLKSAQVKKISFELQFIPSPFSKLKAEQALRNEILTIVRHSLALYTAGQGVCHKYIQQQGRTAQCFKILIR